MPTHRRDVSWWTVGTWTFVLLLLVVAYLAVLHAGGAHHFLHSVRRLGLLGVVLGVGLLTVLSVIPVPGEFVSIFLLQAYGVLWGTAFSWLGAMLGAVLALFAARSLARPLITRTTDRYLQQIEPWLLRRGAVGLLVVRLLPMVPYHLVNYVAGVLRVPFWPFLWTTALGILPFQLALAGVYSGLRYGSVITGVLGAIVFSVMALLGWRLRRHWLPRLGPQHE